MAVSKRSQNLRLSCCAIALETPTQTAVTTSTGAGQVSSPYASDVPAVVQTMPSTVPCSAKIGFHGTNMAMSAGKATTRWTTLSITGPLVQPVSAQPAATPAVVAKSTPL